MSSISIVATVLNEREDIELLVASLTSQVPAAAEVIVVDGGSTDGTWEWLLDAQSKHHGLIAIRDESCNRRQSTGPIARGRNVAIAAATSSIAACADAGCRYTSDWLSRLATPILEGQAEYSLGGAWLDPDCRTIWDVASSIFLGIKLNKNEPTKSCSARSMAFRKKLWERVGGFPESAFFGEDTLFDAKMRSITQPDFPVGAKAMYRPMNTLRSALRQLATYALADGVLRVRPARLARHVARCFAVLLSLLLLPVTPIPLLLVVALEIYFAFEHDWRDMQHESLRVLLARILFSFTVPWVVAWNQIAGRITKSYSVNRQNAV